jgi:GDSL-like Lipase/Acylhydrolase family
MTERTKVLCGLGVALLLYAAAFGVLSLGGFARSVPVVIAGGGCLAVSAVGLQLMLNRARAKDLLPRVRLWLPLGAMAAGAAVAVWSLRTPTGAWGLGGVCAFYLGLGQLIAEWRARDGTWRGPIWCAVCAAVFAVGLAVSLTVSVRGLAVAALALLMGPIGLTLLSEDVLDGRLSIPGPRIVAGLAVTVAAALVLWLVIAVPLLLTLVLVVVLVVLVGAIASSSQADVLLVATVVALVWTTIPRGQDAGDGLDLTQGGRTLVSLGDSYMSGEGAKRYFDGTNHADRNECRRAPTAHAHVVLERGREGAFERLAFFACSGARTRHVHEDDQFPGEPIDTTPDAGLDQLAQLEELLRNPRVDVRLVVVSIGGNDAGFSRIAAACLAPRSCVDLGERWLERLDGVQVDVKRTYEEIRRTVGVDVPVLAVPYPQPIRERSCGYSLLEDDEHEFLHRFVEQLNGVVRQAARDAELYFLDGMERAFGDRGRICDGPREDVAVNFIALNSVNGLVDEAVNPGKWIHNSLHPNEEGHEDMARVVETWLRSHRDPPAVPRPEQLPAPFTRASLVQVMGRDVRHCGGRDEPAFCDRDDRDWALTQIGVHLAYIGLPALLLVAGVWLLWLPLLERTRPWFEQRGADLSDWLLARLPS